MSNTGAHLASASPGDDAHRTPPPPGTPAADAAAAAADELDDELEEEEAGEAADAPLRVSGLVLGVLTGLRDHIVRPFLWGASLAVGLSVGYALVDRYAARSSERS